METGDFKDWFQMMITVIEGVYAGFSLTLVTGRIVLLLKGTMPSHLGETV